MANKCNTSTKKLIILDHYYQLPYTIQWNMILWCCSSKLGLGPDCSILWPPGDDKVLSINTSEWGALKHPRTAMPAAKMCIIECHQVKWVNIKTFSFAVLAPNIECKYTSVTLSASGMQCTHRWRPFVSNGVWEFLMVINFLIHLVAM